MPEILTDAYLLFTFVFKQALNNSIIAKTDADGKPRRGFSLRPGWFDPISQNRTNSFAQNKNDP